MKRIFFIICTVFCFLTTYGQCVDDFDWGTLEYGISPDPENGETFDDGELNIPYEYVINLLVPQYANDVDSNLLALPIDSATISNIIITQGENEYTLEEFGLTLECNNGGSSPNQCTFMGGQSGCGLLSGTPLLAGEFDVVIESFIYVTVLAAVEYPFNYDGYTIFINQIDLTTENIKVVSEVSVSPNPFTSNALVQFESLNGARGYFTIMNLLGEVKYQESLSIKKGLNKIQISSEELDSGIYLYRLEVGEFSVTKRLVVNK